MDNICKNTSSRLLNAMFITEKHIQKDADSIPKLKGEMQPTLSAPLDAVHFRLSQWMCTHQVLSGIFQRIHS